MNFSEMIMPAIEAIQMFMIFALLFKIKVLENKTSELENSRVPVEVRQESKNDLLDRYRREVQNKKFSV